MEGEKKTLEVKGSPGKSINSSVFHNLPQLTSSITFHEELLAVSKPPHPPITSMFLQTLTLCAPAC